MRHDDDNGGEKADGPSEPRSRDIAIVGMAGRFPGARNVEQFWANLAGGVESIRRLSDDELIAAGVSKAALRDPNYVRACPVLDDVDKFDAGFFGMSPRDASVMDPAQRFFLEVVGEALESAGTAALPGEGRVGVFAGSGAPLYLMENLRTNADLMHSMGEFLVRHTGNDMNFMATRASYEYDLRGPSINVQTACSSALVAVHLARQSLLAGECDVALAGGSAVLVPTGQGYIYKEGEILSPDGHCRPFDEKSAGTVFGSGTGCVVLKRLGDALDHGDTILAVVKASAINNDGSQKVGYLAPGVEGQAAVIEAALAEAGLSATDISYVETHGTGTSVGDPIELTALQQAFARQTDRKQFCAIGSVKSNIGHLGEAAAAASIIKVILAMQHRLLPQSLGYEKPNPRFDFDDSAFFVNAALRPWKSAVPGPMRAGITALGAGGTNCHVILESPPAPLPGEGGRSQQLFVLSAKSKPALERRAADLAAHLESHGDLELTDAAYTLSVGRRPYAYRRAFVAASPADAIAALRAPDPQRTAQGTVDGSEPPVVFTFPGGGAQYARMGADLYAQEPAYQEAMDECLALIDQELPIDLRTLLFAPPAEAKAATKALKQPSLSLPALFATEYALAKLFASWGFAPVALVGHSMGEYVAACLAGVFTLHDGLRLVMLRGRLFETVAKGGMVAVSLPEAEVRGLMPAGLSIAAVNAPELCVASGPVHLIAELQAILTAREVDWTPVHIDVAAHSSMLEAILPEFRRFCRTIEFSKPEIPFASNLTGAWITDEQATDPEYWVKHLRGTVRFADCIETVMRDGQRAFLELGPGRTLTTLVGAQKTKVRTAVNSIRHHQEEASDLDYALRAVGRLWTGGVAVDWTALYQDQLRTRIPLPGYPFEKQSFWVHPKVDKGAGKDPARGELARRDDLNEWFYGTSWVPSPRVPSATPAQRWLVFVDDFGVGDALCAQLPGTVYKVRAGAANKRIGAQEWQIEVASPDHHRELLETLEEHDFRPEHVVYLWTLQPQPQASARPETRSGQAGADIHAGPVDRSFFALVALGRALGAVAEHAALSIVSNATFAFPGEINAPDQALALGPLQVIPHEFPGITTRLIDIAAATLPRTATTLPGLGSFGTTISPVLPILAPVLGRLQGALDRGLDRLGAAGQLGRMVTARLPGARAGGGGAPAVAVAAELVRELLGAPDEQIVSLREGTRSVRKIVPVPMPPAPTPGAWASAGSVVLITGGLGGIGLEVAGHLAASRPGVRLALLSRRGLPPEARWPALLADAGTDVRVREPLQRVMALRAAGAEVLAVAGDVTRAESLAAAIATIQRSLGAITGVIHAAGIMDDEPIHSRSRAAMERVLAPKVTGTRNLDALLTAPLDFFVLFSSVASFLGLPGQVDYSAANAFLDAFAAARARRAPGKTFVVNWNAWRDVGMVENVIRHKDAPPPPAHSSAHPALDGYDDDGEGRRFVTDFRVASHWMLSEHRIAGSLPLVPGTGLLELARAAFAEGKPAGTGIELRQVTFVAPFQVAPDSPRRLAIRLSQEPTGSGTGDAETEVVMTSGAPGESDAEGVLHLTAAVRAFAGGAPAPLDLPRLIERCADRVVTPHGGYLEQTFVDFGPRWGNITRIAFGRSEAVVECQLPPAFASDITTSASVTETAGTFALHPALLDMATGAVQPLIPGFDQRTHFFVPFGYERVRVHRAMPAHVFSHVRCLPDTRGDLAYFDVTVTDATGRVCVEIERFTMKRVSASDAIVSNLTTLDTASTDAAAKTADTAPPVATAEARALARKHEAMQAILREAIAPAEGLHALDRMMAQGEVTQVLASSVDVVSWRHQLDEESRRGEEAAPGADAPVFSRPQLGSEYVAPEGSVQVQLAAIWSKLLGVEQVGALDDFFELGGSSLTAVRLFARIKKDFGISLAISTLFQAQNVRALAAYLIELGVKDSGSDAAAGDGAAAPNSTAVVSYRDALDRHSPGPATDPASIAANNSPALAAAADLGSWAHEEIFVRAPRIKAVPAQTGGDKGTWLVFLDGAGVGEALCRRLRARGDTVVRVREGDGFHKSSDSEYTVAPEQGRAAYDPLLAELHARGRWPSHVVHMWTLTSDESFRPGSSFFHRMEERGFYSLSFLAQALAERDPAARIAFAVVGSGLHQVGAEPVAHPIKAAVLGAALAIPEEFPGFSCRVIDLAAEGAPEIAAESSGARTTAGAANAGSASALPGAPSAPATNATTLVAALVAELFANGAPTCVAYRDGQRFGKEVVPAQLPTAAFTDGRLRSRATYLVTVAPHDGSDDLGIALSRALIAHSDVNLLVVAGKPSGAISALLAGAPERIRFATADVSNAEQMRKVLAGVTPPVRGVFHAAHAFDPRPLLLKSAVAMHDVLAPRLSGTAVLDELFAPGQLDFLALCGSLQPLVDTVLHVDAAAAAAFTAAYAGRATDASSPGKVVLSWLFADGITHDNHTVSSNEHPDASPVLATLADVHADVLADLLARLLHPTAPRRALISPVPPRQLVRNARALHHERLINCAVTPATAPPRAATLAPDDLASALLASVETSLRLSQGAATSDMTFSDLGAHPLEVAWWLANVRRAHALAAPLSEMGDIQSVAAAHAFIRAAQARASSDASARPDRFKHLVAMHPGQPTGKAPFFLVAGMFGNVLNLRHLGHLVGAERPVYGIQARGLYGDEKPHATFEDMAEAYLAEIRRVQPHGPYALGGFSGGGLTALEMAQRLRAAGETVALLVMLDTPIPERSHLTARDRAMLQWVQMREKGLAYFSEWAKNRAQWEVSQLRARFEKIDEAYSPDHYKNDAIGTAFYAALDAYKIKPYGGTITLFRPKLDRVYQVGPDRYVNGTRQLLWEDNGWSRYATKVDVFEVSGDHDSMVLEPGVRVLAAKLREQLALVDHPAQDAPTLIPARNNQAATL